jgi:energy-coupling factor transporter ATP-binding protein EcfA2
MKSNPQATKTSDFLMPELTTIGDAICQTLQLGVEEELLGESILSKVRGLIERKQVTSADVVRLALVCDGLRVAEEAILADGTFSELEAGYALPLAQDAAQRLAPFRAYYASIRPDEVRDFMLDHHKDTQLFGGACDDTRWLGLEIVRRLAHKTRARDLLDKYVELMVRLSEEIVSLERGRIPAEQIRRQLDERLGLRNLLLQAEAEAPDQGEDPRIRVFCSPDSPDVFHAVEHANQVWTKDPFDVETVQATPRAIFSRLLRRAAQEKDASTGRVLLILGDAGSGKTHLMRVFRNQVHRERSGYVGYMQLGGAPSDYARYVLGGLIDSLERPYDAPEVPESGLMSLSDTLLLTPKAITPEVRFTLQEAQLTDDELCDLVYKAADEVVSEPRFAGLDLDLIRALLFLQRREPRYYGRVIKFLRGQTLGRHDKALLGELASRSEDALGLIIGLSRLIACVDGGALVLLLDQLEEIYNQQNAKDQFVRLMDVVRQISDQVPNVLVVVSCLSDLYRELKQYLNRSVLDRIERDPEPQRLIESRSLLEIEALVERRLSCLYESQGVRYRSDQPHFPIPRTLLESQAELRLRDVLQHLKEYQQACIAFGRLVDPDEHLPIETLVQPAPAPMLELARAWEVRMQEPSGDAPIEDDDQLKLLEWALARAADELPAGVTMPVERQKDVLLVTTPDRGEGASPLLIRLTNQTSRGGALGRQIESTAKAATMDKRAPVIVRGSDFGGSPGSVLAKQLGAFAKQGGRRVIVEQATWQRLLAVRDFSAQHSTRPEWRDWIRTERPLLRVDTLRDMLGLARNELDAQDKFVARRLSSQPLSGRAPADSQAASASGDRTWAGVSATLSTALPRNDTSQPPAADRLLRIGAVISVKQQAATIELEQLKRHSAFLGASGSGKTSLALNVIEQAAQLGIGTILLDRKGDLASYADPAAWERPEADPQRIRLRQQLRARLHVRLFTPGNPDGLALKIRAVPAGLADLPPQERSHLARFAAQGLGTMMGYKGTAADQTNVAILGKAIEVIGQLSRQEPGLRELIDLLADEDPSLIAELGHLDLKHCKKVVTHLETLRLNHGALLESRDPPLSADILLGRDGSVPDGKTPLTIISTKFLGGGQRVDFWVSQMLVELSRWCSKSPASKLQALLFLDEADVYMPASTKPATKEPLQDLLKRARSAGLGVMLATQSPGDLDYKARDTIGTWWIGRIGSTTAIEKMKPLLSECRTDVSSALATSSVGEFFQISDGQVVRMRSERSLMDTVQLTEERIVELARGMGPRARVVA